jgi:hypothetical protein
MSPDEYLEELKQAVEEYRLGDVGPLTDQIDPAQFDVKQSKKALGLIRRKRLFAEMERLASWLVLAGQNAPVVRRQWA